MNQKYNCPKEEEIVLFAIMNTEDLMSDEEKINKLEELSKYGKNEKAITSYLYGHLMFCEDCKKAYETARDMAKLVSENKESFSIDAKPEKYIELIMEKTARKNFGECLKNPNLS